MQESILRKLEALVERHQEVEQLLSQADVIADQDKFRDLNREYSQLQVTVTTYKEYTTAVADLKEMELMLNGDDPDMQEMAREEIEPTREKVAHLEHELQLLLLPHDKRDDCNCFLEIRAGTGGDEAALFAGDLFKMYTHYVESKGWNLEVVSMSEGEMGGYKEIIAKMSGEGAYGYMKFESGGHRVQRVPATETQGRVHTSACIVVECQDERSQHQNRARAMEVLYSRLAQMEEDKRNAQATEMRHSILASGARSDRIRTYNYPQGRITDHRINLTIYRIDDVLSGNLDLILKPVIEEFKAEQLAQMATQGAL